MFDLIDLSDLAMHLTLRRHATTFLLADILFEIKLLLFVAAAAPV